MISKEKKTQIIAEYGRKEGDTGSPEVQIAILTNEINALTEHLKNNKQESTTLQSILKLTRRIITQEEVFLRW